MHDCSIGARKRRVCRGRAAGWLAGVRHGRHAPPRIARTAAERSCQRRAAEAGRRAGRRAAPLDPAAGRVCRSGALVDAQRGLGRALDVDRAPRPLMTQLPLAARRYVIGVMALGAALFIVAAPLATFEHPVLFVALLVLSSAMAALKVHLPLTTSGSTMSVSYAVDFASLLLLGPH